jgi:arginine decarboxylase
VNKKEQKKTPFFDALLAYHKQNPTPFDVPGHKLGRLSNAFSKTVGLKTLALDVNLPRGLDNLNSPRGVIKQSQKLLADAYGADYGFFVVNGSSAGVISMILAVAKAKEKIIMPRNIHKSVISGLTLSGAIPIFVNPNIDYELGIANSVKFEDFKSVIDQNLDAKAIFLIHPTYFGVVGDAKKVIDYAHSKKMLVISDEAHGAHFPFSPLMPKSAFALGADMAAASMHKTGGSLTQSSILLMRESKKLTMPHVQSILAMLQTTSPSNLMLASLDVARKELAINGEKMLKKAYLLSLYAVKKLNQIKGVRVADTSYFIDKGAFNHDVTKLVIKVNDLGLSGFEVYKKLKDEYSIQMELAESNVVLAIITIGTTKQDILNLINAFSRLSARFYGKIKSVKNDVIKIDYPSNRIRPRDAYNAPKKYVKLAEAEGEISAESIMIYPPGIPLVIPGEALSKTTIQSIREYAKSGITLITQVDGLVEVIDRKKWEKEGIIDEV